MDNDNTQINNQEQPVQELAGARSAISKTTKQLAAVMGFLLTVGVAFAFSTFGIVRDSLREMKRIEKEENLAALLLAGGASIAMHNSNADDHIADNFERHDVVHDLFA